MKTDQFYVDVAKGVQYYLVARYEGAAESKKAVLLLHGATSGYVIWDIRKKDYSVMDYLARQGFVVYAVDMRGFGRSTRTSGLDVRAETCAEDLKRVTDFIRQRLGATDISLVGGSFGCVVALTYAGKRQEDLKKLALLSPPYKDVSDSMKILRQPVIDMANRRAGYYPNVVDPRMLVTTLHSPDTEILDYYAESCVSHCPENPTGVMLDSVQEADGRLVSDKYAPLMNIPTIVVIGANDEVCPADNARLLHDALGTQVKKLVLVPNAGHHIFLEREAHVTCMERICEWLKD
jgi:pimeloyl-ACP methyl ester carboxylesterase